MQLGLRNQGLEHIRKIKKFLIVCAFFSSANLPQSLGFFCLQACVVENRHGQQLLSLHGFHFRKQPDWGWNILIPIPNCPERKCDWSILGRTLPTLATAESYCKDGPVSPAANSPWLEVIEVVWVGYSSHLWKCFTNCRITMLYFA